MKFSQLIPSSLLLVGLVASCTIGTETREPQNDSKLGHKAYGGVKKSPLGTLMRNWKQLITLSEAETQANRKKDVGTADEKEMLKGPVNNEDLFEGDIRLASGDMEAVYGTPMAFEKDDARSQKASSTSRRWPNGIIPFEINNIFHSRERQIILQAIGEYEEKTCLRFRETRNGKRLFFTSEGGCWSYIGQQPRILRQTISLGRGCVHHGTVVHELGHALGFWHKQSRPDRDRYVIIRRENIVPNREHNFNVRRDADYHGEPYNFGSVMHYESTEFSRNGLPTLSVRDQLLYEFQDMPHLGMQRYGREALTDIDARQINKLYGCYTPNSHHGTLSQCECLRLDPFRSLETITFVCKLQSQTVTNKGSSAAVWMVCLQPILPGVSSLCSNQAALALGFTLSKLL